MKKLTFWQWVNTRLPLNEIWERHAAKYYVPKNLNFWYFFGVFSGLVLLNQIITGIWLTMFYTPTPADAFASVEYIMRDVKYGWLLRYLHSTGASAFFIVVYLHMYRSILYGSFKAPRELLWLIGMLIYTVLLVESATGYALPWGQMSYWATKVLVTLFTAIPLIGKDIAVWVAGDYSVSEVTLHRFFALHVSAFPLIILFLTWLHLMALHKVGSNNPEGLELKKDIPFHPYYTVKDLAGVAIFLFVFCAIVFFAPTLGGYFLEPANFAQANPMVTPLHIAPPWYMAPFYSILRAVPNKLIGVCAAAGAIAVLYVLPWLDKSPMRSVRYRGSWTKLALTVLVISFIGLGYLGTLSLTASNIFWTRIFTCLYFLFFVTLPLWSKHEKTKIMAE